MKKAAVDINCDMGESFGRYKLGEDEELVRHITSANVACGFHAGDPHVMRHTVEIAAKHSVRIGAHPGLPDLLGFGRRAMEISPEQLHDFFIYQIGALKAFVEAAGKRLQHVKMHGALLEMALARPELTDAMCAATRAIDPRLIWMGPSGATTVAAKSAGLRVAEEFYCDRAYDRNKRLVSRKLPGAVVKDPAQVRQRLEKALEHGTGLTLEQEEIELPFDTICIHGDTPGAGSMVRLVREVCAEKGVAIRCLAELDAFR
jgi:5-oxoprolinase (ATP-hydrolysing) subunit A